MNSLLAEILNSHMTGKPVIMGILNVTPDSFSDGGCFDAPAIAINHAKLMLEEGADIIDVGAESTRPGSARISAGDQIDRLREIIPAVCSLAAGSDKKRQAVVSVDTTSAEVAAFAIDAGAGIINDISAGRDDPEILKLAARASVPIVLMHMLGQPCDMQQNPTYENVVNEVKNFLVERIESAQAGGVPREHCIVDPGIGFGKTLEHNLSLLGGVAELCDLDCPILIGPSRKRFIGELTGQPDPVERLGGTIAACLDSFRNGATIFRVHDVRAVRDALIVARAIKQK